MRVGLTGAQGVGKTTLARELARILGWRLIEEQARVVFARCPQTKGKFSSAFQWRCLAEQIRLEEDGDDFIADRTVIDNAAYWIKWRMAHSSSAENLAYYRRCQAQAAKYDLVVYVPPEIPLVADGFRSTNTEYQAEMDWLISTLMRGLVPPKRRLTVTGSMDERAARVLERIKKLASMPQASYTGWYEGPGEWADAPPRDDLQHAPRPGH
ncbi:MAG: ATP-binding protein [Bacillota bacterium]|nr:ATP-binding protein [Bacillota bacterium]